MDGEMTRERVVSCTLRGDTDILMLACVPLRAYRRLHKRRCIGIVVTLALLDLGSTLSPGGMTIVNASTVNHARIAPVNRKPLGLTKTLRIHNIKDPGPRTPRVSEEPVASTGVPALGAAVLFDDPRTSSALKTSTGRDVSSPHTDEVEKSIPPSQRPTKAGRMIGPATNPGQQMLNLWTPTPAPATLHRLTPMIGYDINTKLPFHVLETDHIRMEPLVPSIHLEGFLSLPRESWDVLGDMGPYDTSERALADIELFRKDPRKLMLAVVDKQREAKGMDSFAGVYGLIEYNVQERASLDPAEDPANVQNVIFGLINIHPRYHRTHVNSHAMYLILSFLFDEAHLLRVQYDAVTFNQPSIAAAVRFGFQAEGICRNYNGPVPVLKRQCGEEGRPSQDLWVSSMIDSEWEKTCRARLQTMCARPPVQTAKLT